MSRLWRLWGVVLVLIMGLQPAVLGQSEETPKISIQVERSALPDLPDNLAARLSTESGEPISNASITFWAELDILGPRNAFLGSATTDATGIARIPITPRYADYTVKAEFTGAETHGSAETTEKLSFPPERVDPVEIVAPSSPLATLQTVMPRAMGIVVALLWLLFAAAVFYVVKTIHRHGQPAPVLTDKLEQRRGKS